MCGIAKEICGTTNKGCGCMHLKAFTIGWILFMAVICFFQFLIGSSLASFRAYVDVILETTKELIMKMEDPTVALEYYEIVSQSLGQLWTSGAVLTTLRGFIDLIGICFGIAGMSKGNVKFLYIFVGVNAFDFVLDLVLLVIFFILLKALHIIYFFPISVALPVLFYGWQVLLGPYIINVLLSYAYVISVGGSGSEWKKWSDIQGEGNDVESDSTKRGVKEKEKLIKSVSEEKINFVIDDD